MDYVGTSENSYVNVKNSLGTFVWFFDQRIDSQAIGHKLSE